MGRNPSTKLLGQAIRQQRLKKGWSQEELAEYSELHRNYIGSIERGERNVALINIVQIAKTLGLKASDLLKLANL